MNLNRRPALPADEEFLYALHKAAMQPYITATWGPWDEAAQRAQFQQCYQPAEIQILQCDGQDAGMLQLQERSEELFLVGLEILPAFQKRGIGSQVIQQVIQQARQRRKPVALQVLKANPAALALYQRLGFQVTGQNDTYFILAFEVG